MAEVIVALDLKSREEAEAAVDRLPGLAWVKVGSILMTREGTPLVRSLVDRGIKVFLDLKWHDIPTTVAGAVAQARDMGVSMATVHTLGGPRMMEAAVVAGGDELAVVGVTVLTSHTEADYQSLIGRKDINLTEEVVRLAEGARWAGLAGVVCSPREAALVRAALGSRALVVVPGIRRHRDPAGDQARTATPREARAAGATHLVVGRPILAADDPVAAFEEIRAVAG